MRLIQRSRSAHFHYGLYISFRDLDISSLQYANNRNVLMYSFGLQTMHMPLKGSTGALFIRVHNPNLKKQCRSDCLVALSAKDR